MLAASSRGSLFCLKGFVFATSCSNLPVVPRAVFVVAVHCLVENYTAQSLRVKSLYSTSSLVVLALGAIA